MHQIIFQWDEVAQERTMQEWKMGLLADMEARWRAELSGNQTAGYYASSYSSWLGYATGVMANIVDNLQVLDFPEVLYSNQTVVF